MLHPNTLIVTELGDKTVSKVISGMKVDTPEGRRPIRLTVKHTVKYAYKLDTLDGLRVIFDNTQYFLTPNGRVLGRDLSVGDWLLTKKGKSRIGNRVTIVDYYRYYYKIVVYSYRSKFYLKNGILVSG